MGAENQLESQTKPQDSATLSSVDKEEEKQLTQKQVEEEKKGCEEEQITGAGTFSGVRFVL